MKSNKIYSYWLLLPALLIYALLFLYPTVVSFFFGFTRWTLTEWEWIGFENFRMFFEEPSLMIGFKNTFIFAFLTAGLKVVVGIFLAVILTSKLKTKRFVRSTIFFPVLVSTIAVGITFSVLMHPSEGLINVVLGMIGIDGPDWLGNPNLAIYSVALVDVWKGLGIATVILIAGMMSIPNDYYEAIQIDGGNKWNAFVHITLPLSRPAINTVVMLALIGGLRTFDLVWAMTGGGPGFSSDLIASIIYKQYQAGFYGLSTAGNVLLFLIVAIIVYPIFRFLNRKEVDL
ncbi:raffinose/stachyose/melibiose transport system permease protein [Gracilibacillus halotolerans]|uniref:Raffinose/stachyose/melibiose transport system permease protein n=1 Tax=Gracilibacillus halotolerans TaxID=74386 RepID=A0A841RJF7_9BACI|nr:sugar ABC transporter permease [Gracilibacillus halotolerans]MBB6512821.1 raffinose/stachyose/melibiose transport system permease protein [Gracilibacillus halotolerans]